MDNSASVRPDGGTSDRLAVTSIVPLRKATHEGFLLVFNNNHTTIRYDMLF